MRGSTPGLTKPRLGIPSLARSTVTVAILQCAGMILGYAAQVFLARFLDQQYYGVYRYAFAVVFMVGTLATGGFGGAFQRFVPQYRAGGQPELLRGFVRAGFLWGIVASFGASIAVRAVASRLQETARDPLPALALLSAYWIVPIITLRILTSQLARALHCVVTAFAPLYLGRPVAHLAVCVVLYLGLARPNATTPIQIFGVALAAQLVVQTALVHTVWRPLSQNVRKKTAYGEWLRVTIPLLVMAGFGVMLSQVSVVIAGSFLGSRDAAVLSVANQIASLVSLSLVALNNVIAPHIAALWHSGRHTDLQRVLTTSARWALLPAAALAFGCVVFGGQLLRIFGRGFAVPAGYASLVILALAHLGNVAAGSVALVLNVSGQQHSNAMAYGISAVVQVGMSIILLPRIGVVGAAVGYASGLLLWNVILLRVSAKRLRLYPCSLHGFLGRSANRERNG